MQDCESDEIPHEHKKLGEGSPQPGKTMGSPGTLPLWVGIRNSALTPNIEPRLEETSFTLPHRTPRNLRRGLPSLVRLLVAQVPSPLWVGIRNSALTPHIELSRIPRCAPIFFGYNLLSSCITYYFPRLLCLWDCLLFG